MTQTNGSPGFPGRFNEYYSEQVLKELKTQLGKLNYYSVNTRRNRKGLAENTDSDAANIVKEYRSRLRADKLLDYDDILYHAYNLLNLRPEIPETLAQIIRLFCVDEIQDTQDLQYGILSSIFKATSERPTLFVVGDPDQSIYESLGAVTKSADEIAVEFEIDSISHKHLKGNYRSSQRLIDYFRSFRPKVEIIESLTTYAHETGTISFNDQSPPVDEVATVIARLIRQTSNNGVAANEICVLAPQWAHVRQIARNLVRLLPNMDIDAPGLSPFHCQRENLWFKVARLFLSTPHPALYRTRIRWAGEVIKEFRDVHGVALSEIYRKPRSLLRLINSIKMSITDGLDYLDAVFSKLLEEIHVELFAHEALAASKTVFFEKARARIHEIEGMPTDLASFKKFFRHPSGVVISTCHGIKGEEYDTVIVFGLLKGYIPNWDAIINGSSYTAEDSASKLLYVVCSRAKRRLHLIAESGRRTRKGNLYETTELLRKLNYHYDDVGIS